MQRPRAKSRGTSTSEDATTRSPEGHIRSVALEARALDTIYVAFSDAGITSMGFAHHEASFADYPRVTHGPAYLDTIRRYLAGEAVSFDDVPIVLEGTQFQRDVWAALRTIPYGHVVSYAHIAKRVGVPRGMRAVGLANGRNPIPIVVPCHRVVEANGTLGGFSSGLANKRILLALEGVQVMQERVLAGQGTLFTDDT